MSHSQGMIYMENASSITVKDCALKAAGAEKTTIPFFAAIFRLQECDEFTETGSGQTEEKFRQKCVLRRHRGDMDGRGKSEPHYLGQFTERC